MSRGGRRIGAGRPPREIAKEAFTLRVEPDCAQKFRQLCFRLGKSQSELVSGWILENWKTPETQGDAQ